MPVILALGRLRREDSNSKASLSYKMRPFILKKKKKKKL
jgi:hypothetical protein